MKNKEVEVIEVDREKKRVNVRILNVIYTFVLGSDGNVVFEGRGSYERDSKENVDIKLFKKAFRWASAILIEEHKKQKILEKQGKLF